MASNDNKSNVNNEWVQVTKGAKIKKHSIVELTEDKNKSKATSNNKFLVPKALEKKLHHNSGISGLFDIPKGSQKEGSIKCYKRNQRRNKKRAERRLHKVTQHAQNTEKPSKEQIVQVRKDIIDVNNDFLDTNHVEESKNITVPTESSILPLPRDVWTDEILGYLSISDVAALGCCSKNAKDISEDGHYWQHLFSSKYPDLKLKLISDKEWKCAYKIASTEALSRNRCFHTKKTFLETSLGLGIDYTVNPKTKRVDYISSSQDLLSEDAYNLGVKSDTFGNIFKMFLPLYFSAEHFTRVLPSVKRTITRLCPERNTTKFYPTMVLDVFPKLISTFIVLVADEGVAASKKSFVGLVRIHRLFLALAETFPIIKMTAMQRLKTFIKSEEARSKSKCPSLGNLLPLLMIIDEKMLNWGHLRTAYIGEFLTRSVLWAYKAHPQLDRYDDATLKDVDERLRLTLDGAQVGMRLTMLTVNMLSFLCRGTNRSRSILCNNFLEGVEPEEVATVAESNKATVSPGLNFSVFRTMVNSILAVNSWQQFYRVMRLKCPPSKTHMATILRQAAKNSRKKGYHKAGMNYSKIHASGTSSILTKGRQYCASEGLKRVIFSDRWTFVTDETMFLDATCLLYKGKRRIATVDYSNRSAENDAVRHSGDVMTSSSGSHTIELDLDRLDKGITTCMFVLSAWAKATLFDVKTASISFRDADKGPYSSPLCTYDLEAHDKVSHLKSVFMCKLYRVNSGKWHVLAIGDSHRGSAFNYAPVYEAAERYL